MVRIEFPALPPAGTSWPVMTLALLSDGPMVAGKVPSDMVDAVPELVREGWAVQSDGERYWLPDEVVHYINEAGGAAWRNACLVALICESEAAAVRRGAPPDWRERSRAEARKSESNSYGMGAGDAGATL